MSYMKITEKEQAEVLEELASVLVSQPLNRTDGSTIEAFRRIPLSVFFRELYDARRDNPNKDGEEIVYESLGALLRKVSAEADGATTVDDVANMLSGLNHSMFTTSKRIAKYLAGDQTMDGFVRADGDTLYFVSASTSGLTTQATNPSGKKLYWKRDPAAADLGTDGLPYIDDVLIPMTTEVTEWPVTIYRYTEKIQRTIGFEELEGDYLAVDKYGPGSGNTDRGIQYVDDHGLRIQFRNLNGLLSEIRLGKDGYLDFIGQRKPLKLDFSQWDAGLFAERLDGIADDIVYGVNFDTQGRPVLITDETGHMTEIVW